MSQELIIQVYDNIASGALPIQVIETQISESPIFVEIQEDYAPVQSVNGKIGWVTLDKTDIGLSNVENLSIPGTISGMAVLQYNNQTVTGIKTFIDTLYAPNLVYNTGEQQISGVKTFSNKTNVSGVKFKILGTGDAPIPAYEQGLLFYDDANHTLNLYVDNPEVTLQIGQENWVRVKNILDQNINNGQLVYIDGGEGANPHVQLAIANGETNSATTLGMATHNISKNEFGYITTFGLLNNIDTDGMQVGAPLYLSPTISGGYTTTKPQAPNHMVRVGTVIRSNKNNGVIFVNIQNGLEIEELHDVKVTNPQNGEFIAYNSGSGVWYNTNNFIKRPTVNGTEILLSGEAYASNNPSGFLANKDVVLITGNLTVSGSARFANFITPNNSTTPINPEMGQIFFDTVSSNFSGYNGTSWVRLNN